MNGDLDWMARRACTLEEVDPEVFFPVGIGQEAQLLTEYAKEFCNRCKVRAECEDYAVSNRIDFGIWGGKTEDERADDREAKRDPATPVKRRPNHPTTHKRCGTYSGCSRHRRLNEAYCDPCKDAKNAYERDRKARMRADREELSA